MMSTFVWQVWQVEGWLYSADCALNQGGAGSPQVGVGGGPPKPSFSGSISTNNQNGPDLQAVITIIMTMTLTITMTRSQKLAFIKLGPFQHLVQHLLKQN